MSLGFFCTTGRETKGLERERRMSSTYRPILSSSEPTLIAEILELDLMDIARGPMIIAKIIGESGHP